MATKEAANEVLGRSDEAGISIPPGHIGPVLLSSTGRTIWWTGRVAIGLRYEPRRATEQMGSSALRLQEALLRRPARPLRSPHAD